MRSPAPRQGPLLLQLRAVLAACTPVPAAAPTSPPQTDSARATHTPPARPDQHVSISFANYNVASPSNTRSLRSSLQASTSPTSAANIHSIHVDSTDRAMPPLVVPPLGSVRVPNLRAPIATVAVLSFLTTWNEYFWPLFVTSKPDCTVIQVGLQMVLSAEGEQLR